MKSSLKITLKTLTSWHIANQQSREHISNNLESTALLAMDDLDDADDITLQQALLAATAADVAVKEERDL